MLSIDLRFNSMLSHNNLGMHIENFIIQLMLSCQGLLNRGIFFLNNNLCVGMWHLKIKQ
jgi:hypothetical protein